MIDDFKDSGGQNAISIALLAAVRAHPDPQRAARAALTAVEAERVLQLYSTQAPAAWLLGFAEAHEALQRLLSPEAGEPPAA